MDCSTSEGFLSTCVHGISVMPQILFFFFKDHVTLRRKFADEVVVYF